MRHVRPATPALAAQRLDPASHKVHCAEACGEIVRDRDGEARASIVHRGNGGDARADPLLRLVEQSAQLLRIESIEYLSCKGYPPYVLIRGPGDCRAAAECQRALGFGELTLEPTAIARIRALPDLPDFIRSLVGLDRKAAQIAFNHALALLTLSVEQIRFVEMIVDHLTSSGRMEPELLYAPPFTDSAPNGVSDVFDGTAVEAILGLLEEMNPRLAA